LGILEAPLKGASLILLKLFENVVILGLFMLREIQEILEKPHFFQLFNAKIVPGLLCFMHEAALLGHLVEFLKKPKLKPALKPYQSRQWLWLNPNSTLGRVKPMKPIFFALSMSHVRGAPLSPVK
jgi:hypothetical protein